MEFKSFIGVDVSKLTLDLCLINPDGEIKNFKIDNGPAALKKLFVGAGKVVNLEGTLVCSEYTGYYSNPLKVHCLGNGIGLWLESGAEIKLRSYPNRSKRLIKE